MNKKTFSRILSFIVFTSIISLINICPVRADIVRMSEWYQPECTAWDNIYGSLYTKYDAQNFANGQYLSECVNGNIAPGGVMIYLDFGYFTGSVAQLKSLGRIPQDYQLPKSFYTIKKTGGTYKYGVYNAPNIVTECPYAMERYNMWRNKYVNGVNYAMPSSNYVPKYILEQSGQLTTSQQTPTDAASGDQAALIALQQQIQKCVTDYQMYVAQGDMQKALREVEKCQKLLGK